MKNKFIVIILLCLSLGLAPFKPQPHVIEKLKWLYDGGNGMQLMDYFDLLLHGTPWLLLIFLTIRFFIKGRNQ